MLNARCYISDDEDDGENNQSMPALADEGELECRHTSSLAHYTLQDYAGRFIESADESSASWPREKSSESPEVLLDSGVPAVDVITIGNSPYRPRASDFDGFDAPPGRPSIVLVDGEFGDVAEGEGPKDVVITISSTSPVIADEQILPSTSSRGPPIISPRLPLLNIVNQPGRSNVVGGSKQGGSYAKQDKWLAKLNEKKQQLQAITGEVISAMHNSISTAPESIPTATPEGLRIELMGHQKTALTWLLWREKQWPPGGILADDMGLGKTLSVIALILQSKRLTSEGVQNEVAEKARSRIIRDTPKSLIRSKATLVVAPTSLVYQWEKEVKDRVNPDQLRVCIFHGPKTQREKKSAFQLAGYDIVITTYNLIATELSDRRSLVGTSHSVQSPGRSDSDECNSPFAKKTKSKNEKNTLTKRYLPKDTESILTKILWERVVLDEAHQIKNRRSLVSRGCCRIPSVHRWCVTGTPVHNELWDLFSLIRFLQVSPFAEEPVWKDLIMSGQKHSAQRLNTLVKGILLRRTKQQVDVVTKKPIIELTVRRLELVPLELQGLEAKCYSIMFEVAKQKVKAVLQDADQWGCTTMSTSGCSKKAGAPIRNPFLQGSRFIQHGSKFQAMSCILALLLRLRQACVHLALTRNAVDMDAFKDDSAVVEEEGGMASLDRTLASLSLDESALHDTDEKENVRAIFEPTYLSTKISSLLARLRNIIDTGDKCVIVSQWTSVLEMIEHHLRSSKIPYTTINGSVLCKDRQERVDSFNRTNGGAQVLLLSLTAGGVGLNLVGGNHLFMVSLAFPHMLYSTLFCFPVDPHWNPAIEAQACDRIYRMGQQKDVFIHRFICQKTIEQRVVQLQERKLALAKSVLEGATATDLSKLTVTDIKWLFELGSADNHR